VQSVFNSTDGLAIAKNNQEFITPNQNRSKHLDPNNGLSRSVVTKNKSRFQSTFQSAATKLINQEALSQQYFNNTERNRGTRDVDIKEMQEYEPPVRLE